MAHDDSSTDRELLEAWRHGDKAAARQLIGRYGPRLYNFFANKVASSADELCQQTLTDCVAARERIEDDEGQHSFRSFLFTVARRKLLNHYRHWERHGRRLDPLEHSVADVVPGMSEAVAMRERQRQLHAALRVLPVDFQVALELHYWEGMTTAEIARVLEAPEGTVKARLARGRQRLEKILADARGLEDRTLDSPRRTGPGTEQ